jgi:hypothetical protein
MYKAISTLVFNRTDMTHKTTKLLIFTIKFGLPEGVLLRPMDKMWSRSPIQYYLQPSLQYKGKITM